MPMPSGKHYEMKDTPKKKGKGKQNTHFFLMGPGEGAAPVPEGPRARAPKPKGMRDVLYERGLLDPTKKYTISNEVHNNSSNSKSFVLMKCFLHSGRES
jgi:hypothetical protein